MGLILFEVDHKVANTNQVFDQSDGALVAYDPSNRFNNINAVRLT